jgi:hypothetical protein
MDYARVHRVTHFIMTDLERSGVPNLAQGLEVYDDHFQRVYTTDSFAIVAVRSYDYPTRPAVKDDWYVGTDNLRKSIHYDWHDLWSFKGSNAFKDVWDVWSQWRIRAQKGIWELAKDRDVPAPMRYPVGATLGDAVALVGYDLSTEQVRPGGSFELTLYWRCLRPMAADYTVFTHALNPAGAVSAQKDNPPLGGARPTSRWEIDEMVRDRYVLTMDPAALAGKYAIEIGMYDAQTGRRLPVRNNDGHDAPNARVLVGPIKVK